MNSSIQTYSPAELGSFDSHAGPAHDPAIGEAQHANPGGGAAIRQAWSMLRRRWQMAVILWLVPAAGTVAIIHHTVRPHYEATAYIEVAPVEQKILYDDQHAVVPYFEVYLNTQAQELVGVPVLSAALKDDRAQEVLLAAGEDALASLQASVSAENLRKTHLLALRVKQDQREAAVRLAGAIVDAYMLRQVGQDQQHQRNRQEILESERDRLAGELKRHNDEIYQLARTYGATSEAMLDVLRKGHEENALETKKEYQRAEVQVLELEQQMLQLEGPNGHDLIRQNLAPQRSAMIENDPRIRAIRARIAETTAWLHGKAANLSPESSAVQNARADLERLEDELRLQADALAAEFDRQIAGQRDERLAEARGQIDRELAIVRSKRDALRDRVSQLDEQGLAIGRCGVELQAMQRERDMAKEQYDKIVEELRKLDIESRRPARISVSSPPQILADGVKDNRRKFGALAVMGCLALSLGLSLLRDWMDPHLRDVAQVEHGTGLRVLGTVPSLKELRARAVSQEDFVESYRVIRTAVVRLLPAGKSCRSLLVTSATAGEAKTSLAVSLAISLTEPGHRVLLIDGDSQVPQIARLLRVEVSGTLREVLCGEREVEECVAGTSIAHLDVLANPPGHSAVTGALDAASAGALLSKLRDRYEYIVVDSPPALGAADAMIWSSVVDGVVLASLVGNSDRSAMRMAYRRLESVGARVLGVVAANVSRYESVSSYSQYSHSRRNSYDGDAGTSREQTALVTRMDAGRPG